MHQGRRERELSPPKRGRGVARNTGTALCRTQTGIVRPIRAKTWASHRGTVAIVLRHVTLQMCRLEGGGGGLSAWAGVERINAFYMASAFTFYNYCVLVPRKQTTRHKRGR